MAIMRYVAMERKRPDLTKIPHNCPQEVTFFKSFNSNNFLLVDWFDDKMLGTWSPDKTRFCWSAWKTQVPHHVIILIDNQLYIFNFCDYSSFSPSLMFILMFNIWNIFGPFTFEISSRKNFSRLIFFFFAKIFLYQYNFYTKILKDLFGRICDENINDTFSLRTLRHFLNFLLH